jgi:hypothetical protein
MLLPNAITLLGLFLQSPFAAALAGLDREQASAVIGLAVAADHLELDECDADELDEMGEALPGVWADTSWVAETIVERRAEIDDETISRLDLDESDEPGLAQMLVEGVPAEAVDATMTLMAFLGYNPDSGALDDDYVDEQIRFLAAHHGGTADADAAIERGIAARLGEVPGALPLGEFVEMALEPDDDDPLALQRQVVRAMVATGELSPSAEVATPDPDSPTYTMVFALSDYDYCLYAWAVPDSVIGERERAGLEAVAGQYFAFWFFSEIDSELWPDALLLVTLLGSRRASEEAFATVLPEFESRFEQYDLELDTDALAKRLDEWNEYRIDLSDPASYAKVVSNVTCLREAM